MRIENLWSNKKNLFLILLIFAFVVSGLLEPLIRSNKIKNWDSDLVYRIEKNENKILNAINRKINNIVELSGSLKKSINKKIIEDNLEFCFDLIISEEFQKYHIQINDAKNGTICWNNPIAISDELLAIKKNELSRVFFTRKDLSTYISLVDTFTAGSKKYLVCISEEIEKHYKLPGTEFNSLNLSDSLSKSLSTTIEIEYWNKAELSKDGRKHSFSILNNYKNKIGVATFEKPTIDLFNKELEEIFRAIQSFLSLIIYLTIGVIGFASYRKVDRRLTKLIILVLYLAVLRILLFTLGIPSNFLHSELTDPSNFSSVFAFGIVRSPLDFFITVLGLLIIILVAYKHSSEYFDTNKINHKNILRYFTKIIFTGLFTFLILRSLGASLRSVVFDSTIRYFKEFALIPSPSVLLMDLNILILGFCVLLVSTILLRWTFIELPISNKKLEIKWVMILFLIFQLLGWLFDFTQKQPQATPFIRILFITIIFILTYLTYNKGARASNFIYYGFASSILVVSLLVHYNSEIERESLKTTAYELIRANESVYEFILYQTLIQSDINYIKSDPENVSINYSALSFELWNKSLLFKENIPSSILLYDSKKKLLGYFSNYDKNIKIDIEKYEIENEPKIFKQQNFFGTQQILIGINPLSHNGEQSGYLVATVLYDKYYLSAGVIPKFLTFSRSGIASATEYENLKIFFFVDDEPVRSFGGISLNSSEINRIVEAPFINFKEAWLRIDLKGEPHLAFAFKPNESETELIAVALEERRFAWKLSNFFKVFFVHSVIIFFTLLIYSAGHLRKWKEYFQRYKTKLTFAFILVSVVPLIAIAAYIRDINEEKNEELINNRLTELAFQIESYINNYSEKSQISDKYIYDKASVDLTIEFSTYDSSRLIYSSNENYYETGLFPSTLNPSVYLGAMLGGSDKTFVKESVNGEQFYSLYLKSNFHGLPVFINANTMFNRVPLPLSDVELDIFLFGILAAALILLTVLSTILAEQISSPIRRLTHATRSIGSGDLNIEITEKSSGEIGELTSGFNMMIQRLKKSQIELAQLERETAWKEMAKQVAHEIKNPLTPMKLSVQQLIAAYRDKSPKFDEIFQKVTTTFINQIETLKNIASEFSSFARMPKMTIEKIDLVLLIKETLNLFADEKYPIYFHTKLSSVYVNADPDHLGRAIINLVRNSLQADASFINVVLSINSGMCEIRIEDNGTGISPVNLERIFENNFTTKPQGMGLGLTMAKKFIGSIGGNISIEITSNQGTTFLITLPKVD
jgi:signal transduction histidine kinase